MNTGTDSKAVGNGQCMHPVQLAVRESLQSMLLSLGSLEHLQRAEPPATNAETTQPAGHDVPTSNAQLSLRLGAALTRVLRAMRDSFPRIPHPWSTGLAEWAKIWTT